MLRNRKITLIFLGAALLTGTVSLLAGSEVAYDPGNRRDPFMPLSAEENTSMVANPSSFKLEGIIYDPGGRSVAMLHGKTYQQGDAVGDAKIVKIHKDHVLISKDGDEKVFWIRTEDKT